MKNTDLKPEEAKKAWNEFYTRYSRYVWNRCLSQCRTAPEGDVLAKDVFQNTMQKVYENAEKFDADKNEGVKGWLSSIVHNEFCSYFNKYHLKFSNEEYPDIEDPIEDEEVVLIEDAVYDKIVGIQFEALKKLLTCLTSKEYTVIITYMKYHQLDNPRTHLPDPEMRKLCSDLKITSATARQIKRRGLLKLRKLAEQL
jgi:RNA polymerase sigma factor (sigma-70 family)